MSAVIQATCPGCKKLLRLPAEWVNESIRCKQCGMVVQVKKRSTPTTPKLASTQKSSAPTATRAPRKIAAAAPARPAVPVASQPTVQDDLSFAVPAPAQANPADFSTLTFVEEVT